MVYVHKGEGLQSLIDHVETIIRLNVPNRPIAQQYEKKNVTLTWLMQKNQREQTSYGRAVGEKFSFSLGQNPDLS